MNWLFKSFELTLEDFQIVRDKLNQGLNSKSTSNSPTLK